MSERTISDLRGERFNADDLKQVEVCDQAMEGDEAARAQCAVALLQWAAETAAVEAVARAKARVRTTRAAPLPASTPAGEARAAEEAAVRVAASVASAAEAYAVADEAMGRWADAAWVLSHAASSHSAACDEAAEAVAVDDIYETGARPTAHVAHAWAVASAAARAADAAEARAHAARVSWEAFRLAITTAE